MDADTISEMARALVWFALGFGTRAALTSLLATGGRVGGHTGD